MSDEDVKADDCFDDGQQHCPDKQPSLQFKHRVALLKSRARRWKHQTVLQVERNSWSRQYINLGYFCAAHSVWHQKTYSFESYPNWLVPPVLP